MSSFKVILAFLKTAYFGFCLIGKNELDRNQVKKKWGCAVLKTLGYTLTIEGTPPVQGSYVLVGNHISYLDIPVLMAALPEVTFISKDDLKKWPIIGACATAAGTIYVDRNSGRNGRDVKNKMLNVLKDPNRKMAVFPAGTTSLYEQKPWKNGIFKMAKRADVPVKLFLIGYTPLRASAYIDDDNLLSSMSGLTKIKEKTVSLQWLDEFKTIEDPTIFSQRLQKKVAATLVSLFLISILVNC